MTGCEKNVLHFEHVFHLVPARDDQSLLQIAQVYFCIS